MTEPVLRTSEVTSAEELAVERQSTYEALRDNVENQDVRVSWRDGDRWSRYARETYDKLAADEDLSEQGKADRAQAAYDTAIARADKGYDAARARAQKLASEAELRSVPMPGGRTLFANELKDPTELLAVQHGARFLLSKIENLNAKLPNDVRGGGSRTTNVLREAFADAMERGGIEGTVLARATFWAAEALGVSRDEVVNPFREQNHFEAADNSRRYSVVAMTIPTSRMITKPPFTKNAPMKGQFHTGSTTPRLFTKNSGGQQTVAKPGGSHVDKPKKRKPSWK